MYEECCSIAKASGQAIGDMPKAIEMLTKVGSPFTASMLRDLLSGQKTEHEHILGQMISQGEQNGMGCQLLKMAYTQMAVAQIKNLF
jgi:2-dehydropantoate 2-reductase